MFGEFIEELQNPSLLKPFDEVFELQLPLRNAKLKFHSKVWKFNHSFHVSPLHVNNFHHLFVGIQGNVN